MDSAPTILLDKIVTPETTKVYSSTFEISSDKKNKYKISINNEQDKVKLLAININSVDIKSNEYQKEVPISELKNNKYLAICETTNDMLEELFNLIDNKKYALTESGDKELILSIEIPMKSIKEITFNLEKKVKDSNEIINDLIVENNELKSKIEVMALQIKDLKDDIDYLKNKSPEEKIKQLSSKLNDKIDNLELKINEEKLNEKKENQSLISQVNILTKKIIQIEKDLEQEKINNKKILEKLNQKSTNPSPSHSPSSNNKDNNNNQNKTNEEFPFRTSKSGSIPELIFESVFGSILNKPELGKKGKSKLHEHILVFSNYKMKDPEYALGCYYCDHCKQECSKNVNNYHCKPCHFDLCERCFKLTQC